MENTIVLPAGSWTSKLEFLFRPQCLQTCFIQQAMRRSGDAAPRDLQRTSLETLKTHERGRTLVLLLVLLVQRATDLGRLLAEGAVRAALHARELGAAAGVCVGRLEQPGAPRLPQRVLQLPRRLVLRFRFGTSNIFSCGLFVFVRLFLFVFEENGWFFLGRLVGRGGIRRVRARLVAARLRRLRLGAILRFKCLQRNVRVNTSFGEFDPLWLP